LKSVEEDVKMLQEIFDVDYVQFLLNSDGEWKFNYLNTKEGAVVGRKKSFSRQSTRLELKKGLSIGADENHDQLKLHKRN